MTAGARIGVLGGTLDPFHLGHLDMAMAAREALALDRILVVPSHVPPHRSQPLASTYHRFAMAALAVNGHEALAVSDEELSAPGPSFTAETLARLQSRGLAASQIFFIIGADAFAEIETWRRYPDVLDLAQFVVVSRPGLAASQLSSRLPALAGRMRTPESAGDARPGASIYLVDARTRDISSTEIRRRLARGERVSGLVARTVEAHILQHGLYAATPHDGSTRSTADHLHGQD